MLYPSVVFAPRHSTTRNTNKKGIELAASQFWEIPVWFLQKGALVLPVGRTACVWQQWENSQPEPKLLRSRSDKLCCRVTSHEQSAFCEQDLLTWTQQLSGHSSTKGSLKIVNSLPTSVMVLKNKALGPSVFHLGWQPEEILKRERLKLITVILVSPARSPIYWKEIYAISAVSKTSKN